MRACVNVFCDKNNNDKMIRFVKKALTKDYFTTNTTKKSNIKSQMIGFYTQKTKIILIIYNNIDTID